MGGRIAVTGATGFLGSHVCDVLLDAGHAVRAAHRPTSDLSWLRGEALDPVPTDLDDPASLDILVDGCTGVVHAAGVVMADEATYRRVNVEGTRAVMAAAERSGSVERLVFVSSLAAGGPAGLTRPRDEAMPDAPITGYGRSKLAAEGVLASDGPVAAVVLRPPSLYGPRDREFGPLLRAAAHGWTARFGRRMQGLSLVHGFDAATAAVALLEASDARGVYHVDDGSGVEGGGRRWPWGYGWDELQSALNETVGRRVRRLPIPLGLLRMTSRLVGARRRSASPVLHPDRIRDLDTPGWVCSAARLRRDTSWRPRYDLTAGLRDTLDFYHRHGWM